MEQLVKDARLENIGFKAKIQSQESQIEQFKSQIAQLDAALNYKQTVWAQFEQELSQVLKKDTPLYKQI